MKNKLLALIVLLVMASAYGAVTYTHYVGTVNSVTVDNQHTATAWDLVDSMIVVSDSAGAAIISLSGVAVMDPGDKLYVSFTNSAYTAAPVLDTFILDPKVPFMGSQRFPFYFEYLLNDSTVSDIRKLAGATDTIYAVAAAGGGGITEAVTLEDVVFEIIINESGNVQ